MIFPAVSKPSRKPISTEMLRSQIVIIVFLLRDALCGAGVRRKQYRNSVRHRNAVHPAAFIRDFVTAHSVSPSSSAFGGSIAVTLPLPCRNAARLQFSGMIALPLPVSPRTLHDSLPPGLRIPCTVRQSCSTSFLNLSLYLFGKALRM
jgi:hypothetical protein